MSKCVKHLITDTIGEHVSPTKWVECYSLLNELDPGKSRDRSTGYLTYNVPDKPRMKIKTARFLTRKLNLNSHGLPDSLIQQIAEKINMTLYLVDLSIELVHGKAITKAYKQRVGNGSCMTGNNAKYTLLYEMNPERFSMLIMTNCNNSARAIVAKLDNGKYYMDRVYSDSVALKEKMYSYAKDKGWYDRTKLGSYSDSIILKVSNLVYKNGHIPYMDSFHYGIIENNKLNISVVKSGKRKELCLQNINGNTNTLPVCYICGEDLRIDDEHTVVDGNNYCRGCFNTHFVNCDKCFGVVYKEDVIFIKDIEEQWCKDCADSYATKCADCNETFVYYSKDHNFTIIAGGLSVCESCSDNYERCDCCEQYVRDELKDGKCENCFIPDRARKN